MKFKLTYVESYTLPAHPDPARVAPGSPCASLEVDADSVTVLDVRHVGGDLRWQYVITELQEDS